MLVGPEGAGKNMLLSRLFAAQRGTQVAVVHCSAQTLSTHVIHKLSQQCLVSQTQSGRLYRPKDAARLVLYLKDINLPKPDKYETAARLGHAPDPHLTPHIPLYRYETAELVAFLQQLVTYKVRRPAIPASDPTVPISDPPSPSSHTRGSTTNRSTSSSCRTSSSSRA